jgi:hypothetical protein
MSQNYIKTKAKSMGEITAFFYVIDSLLATGS